MSGSKHFPAKTAVTNVLKILDFVAEIYSSELKYTMHLAHFELKRTNL